jgi:hypothetical protein
MIFAHRSIVRIVTLTVGISSSFQKKVSKQLASSKRGELRLKQRHTGGRTPLCILASELSFKTMRLPCAVKIFCEISGQAAVASARKLEVMICEKDILFGGTLVGLCSPTDFRSRAVAIHSEKWCKESVGGKASTK